MNHRILLRLPRGVDLLDGVLEACRRHGLQSAWIQGIGALEEPALAWYDQQAGRYVENHFPGGWELASLSGNLSLRDGEPFLHLHAVLGGPDGRSVAGHVLPGCRVFACELALLPVDERLERVPDPATGLALWPL